MTEVYSVAEAVASGSVSAEIAVQVVEWMDEATASSSAAEARNSVPALVAS